MFFSRPWSLLFFFRYWLALFTRELNLCKMLAKYWLCLLEVVIRKSTAAYLPSWKEGEGSPPPPSLPCTVPWGLTSSFYISSWEHVLKIRSSRLYPTAASPVLHIISFLLFNNPSSSSLVTHLKSVSDKFHRLALFFYITVSRESFK